MGKPGSVERFSGAKKSPEGAIFYGREPAIY
jgi:hypothetical protein